MNDASCGEYESRLRASKTARLRPTKPIISLKRLLSVGVRTRTETLLGLSGEGRVARDARAAGADTTAATATPQGWVARALSRGTHSEEREYGDDYSKRDSAVNSGIGWRVFQQRNAPAGRGIRVEGRKRLPREFSRLERGAHPGLQGSLSYSNNWISRLENHIGGISRAKPGGRTSASSRRGGGWSFSRFSRVIEHVSRIQRSVRKRSRNWTKVQERCDWPSCVFRAGRKNGNRKLGTSRGTVAPKDGHVDLFLAGEFRRARGTLQSPAASGSVCEGGRKFF